MRQEDFILREIEKISMMLLGLLGKLKRIEELQEQETENSLDEMNNVFWESTSLDLDALLAMENESFVAALTEHIGFDNKNLELFADFISEITIVNPNSKDELFQKALYLYRYIDTESKSFSLDRMSKISNIEASLLM